MSRTYIKCQLDSGAYAPIKAYEDDAGFDIRAPHDVIIPAKGCALIDTGVHFQIPKGYCGFLKSKSGLNTKFGLRAEGVIDSGYTGAVKVNMFNDSSVNYKFTAGDKVTQIVFLPIPKVTLVVTDILDDDTARGDGGFGSTGR